MLSWTKKMARYFAEQSFSYLKSTTKSINYIHFSFDKAGLCGVQYPFKRLCYFNPALLVAHENLAERAATARVANWLSEQPAVHL
jgi:hypothetical protein